MASNTYRSFADYAISGLNMAQNNFDAYIDMSKTYSGLVTDNISEMSQMALNYSKMLGPIPLTHTSNAVPRTISTTIPHDVEEDDEEYNLPTLRKLKDELREVLRIAISSS